MKDYTIKQGKHFSGLRFRPVFFKSELHVIFSFSESCLYDFGDHDQADINKLIGFSFGYHRRNSVRLGWRAVDDKIEILSYIYSDSHRIQEWEQKISLGYVRPNEIAYAHIKKERIFYSFLFRGDDSSGEFKYLRPSRVCPIGYMLYPYFGGNKKAPHDMNIKMEIF